MGNRPSPAEAEVLRADSCTTQRPHPPEHTHGPSSVWLCWEWSSSHPDPRATQVISEITGFRSATLIFSKTQRFDEAGESILGPWWPTPHAQHLLGFCISEWAPGRQILQLLLLREKRTRYIWRYSFPFSRGNQVLHGGFGRDLDSVLLPFKRKLKTAFSTFSPVNCLVIYVCPA